MNIVQIIGVTVTSVALLVAIDALLETQGQVSILNQTLTETQNQVNELKKIAESNVKQVTILESTLQEIQHQTIVNAYENGGKFDVLIDGCGKGEIIDENGDYLVQLSYDPIMVTEKGTYTTVPFRIFFTYWFSGTSLELGSRYEYIRFVVPDTYVYNPSEPARMNLNLKDIQTEAENLGYTGLKIDLRYSFRPFSPVKEGTDFIADQSPPHEKTLAKLSFSEDDGKWYVLDLRNQEPEIICK